MKSFLKFISLSIAIFFGLLILVYIFQNLTIAKTQYFLFLLSYVDDIPPFIIIFIIAFLGIMVGFFAALTVFEFLKTGDNSLEEDE